MTSWPEARTGSPRAFRPADTSPSTGPRPFVTAPGGGVGSQPRAFTGMRLPRSAADTEALRAEREAARTAGWAAGWAAGMRQAAEEAAADRLAARQAATAAAAAHEAQRAAALARAESAVRQAADAISAQRLPAVAALADTVLELALELAGAVLDREVTLMASPVHEAVQRALRPLDDERPVTVRVHPDDLDALTGDGRTGEDPAGDALKGAAGAADAGRVSFLPDPTVSPGDAIARQGDTDVDAGLRASVARALEALVSPDALAGAPAAGGAGSAEVTGQRA
ncbi:flagellar assembly protein FliH [Paenibacillus sp. TRM 82003]|uniref:FliH/SctL family protein n=1 Tax=Kineococcus sp. TRM81007 TaxID=2925831 RepID=UPI001F5AE92A|nr:FliH/SctL family protein [Kineococcus sp. TRM81007]MCI2240610.1 flagellar assembly protein FliH [Kineococcus sp. TRM81007]MCI3925468.1 flagellar assembly protein FliH [Paenibacillus sp. TRM 82003]